MQSPRSISACLALVVASVAFLIVAICILMVTLWGTNLNSAAIKLLSDAVLRILFGAGIFAAVVWGRSATRKGFSLLVFSLTCLVGAILFAHNFEIGVQSNRERVEAESRQFASSMKQALEAMTNGRVPPPVISGNRKRDVALEPVNELLQRFIGELQEMEKQIAALKANDIFLDAVLTNQSMLSSEIQKRIYIQNIIKRSGDQMPTIINSVRTKYNASADEESRAALRFFDDALKEAPQFSEMFSIRLRREEAEQALLEFLWVSFGEYTLTEDTITFQNQTNSIRYRELVSDIERAIAAGEEFQKHRTGAARNEIEVLR